MNDIVWHSEEGNDRWVAEIFKYKHGGFFVDAGATAGRNNSALALEKQLGWHGISVNANSEHAARSVDKHQRMNMENSALWSHNRGIEFYWNAIGDVLESETSFNGNKQDLSYMSAVKDADILPRFRTILEEKAQLISVPSITLERLLEKYHAPSTIEYIGMDIEGSEYEVLSVFPFDKYKILTMSVEFSDGFQPFLEGNGFTRVVNPFCPKSHEHHYVNNCIIGEYKFGIHTH